MRTVLALTVCALLAGCGSGGSGGKDSHAAVHVAPNTSRMPLPRAMQAHAATIGMAEAIRRRRMGASYSAPLFRERGVIKAAPDRIVHADPHLLRPLHGKRHAEPITHVAGPAAHAD